VRRVKREPYIERPIEEGMCGRCRHWRVEPGDRGDPDAFGTCGMLAVMLKRGEYTQVRRIYPAAGKGPLRDRLAMRREDDGEFMYAWEEAGRVVGIEDAWHQPMRDYLDRPLWEHFTARAWFGCSRYEPRLFADVAEPVRNIPDIMPADEQLVLF
jgi:hypothetical protein